MSAYMAGTVVGAEVRQSLLQLLSDVRSGTLQTKQNLVRRVRLSDVLFFLMIFQSEPLKAHVVGAPKKQGFLQSFKKFFGFGKQTTA